MKKKVLVFVLFLSMLLGLTAVSYTHLDVYKRQDEYLPDSLADHKIGGGHILRKYTPAVIVSARLLCLPVHAVSVQQKCGRRIRWKGRIRKLRRAVVQHAYDAAYIYGCGLIVRGLSLIHI